jgi:hypothetical protein
MFVLSRKPGESIVLGFVAFTRKTEAVPSLPVNGSNEPTASGGGTPAPCQAGAALPGLARKPEARKPTTGVIG